MKLIINNYRCSQCGHQRKALSNFRPLICENCEGYKTLEELRHQCSRCGGWGAIVNACGCDPNNLPTSPS